ncbi:MAG: hypothetical protein HYX76_07355 [Acidobacteria bacterium]|nr:hypothetical protein [Acidobacteriota bacterium]
MRRAATALLPVLFVGAVCMGAYALLQRSVATSWEAARALERIGRTADALARYEELGQSLERAAWLRRFFSDAYTDAAVARLRLLDDTAQYGRVLELGDRFVQDPAVTDRAALHFWIGTALLQRGLVEEKPEDVLPWFHRGLSSLKRALEEDPAARWSIRYNYELAKATVDRATRDPGQAPQQIVRPQRGQPRTKKIAG